MRVPYDVLLAILDIQSSRADVQTISSMSQTCQVLRSAGVRHLLAHPIDLRDSRGVTSFNSFMQAERGRRFSLLRRRLAITTGSLPPDAAEALVELVCKISHLERLVLLDAEHLLASDPRLPRAFAALRKERVGKRGVKPVLVGRNSVGVTLQAQLRLFSL